MSGAPEVTIARIGDALLWAWGDCKKSGKLEAVLHASVAAVSEDRTPRAPGAHSDPTMSRVLAAEREEATHGSPLWTALRVEKEMGHWRRDRHQRFWTIVADAFYAGPHVRENAEVGRLLNVSERTVERIRSQMRRYLVMAANRP